MYPAIDPHLPLLVVGIKPELFLFFIDDVATHDALKTGLPSSDFLLELP
jgi:hypothetical protein